MSNDKKDMTPERLDELLKESKITKSQKKRYFIIFWKKSGLFSGTQGHATISENGFPNRTNLKCHLARELGFDPDHLLVTNIIELSKQDFESWKA